MCLFYGHSPFPPCFLAFVLVCVCVLVHVLLYFSLIFVTLMFTLPCCEPFMFSDWTQEFAILDKDGPVDTPPLAVFRPLAAGQIIQLEKGYFVRVLPVAHRLQQSFCFVLQTKERQVRYICINNRMAITPRNLCYIFLFLFLFL